jgi:hypothetical protein
MYDQERVSGEPFDFFIICGGSNGITYKKEQCGE